jgi:hypothetical protein
VPHGRLRTHQFPRPPIRLPPRGFAPERIGIPPRQRVVLSSGQVEDLLTVPLFNMGADLAITDKYNGHQIAAPCICASSFGTTGSLPTLC